MSEINEKSRNAAKLLALGSWHIYNRQTLDESVAFVDAALSRGIKHFDIADYWETDFKNTARFKEVMRILGRPREDYIIGLKVFTNSEVSREDEVKRFLDLAGIDYADYILCSRPAANETMEFAVEAMDGLVKSGLTKELDFSLWDAPQLSQAYEMMKGRGLSLPKFVQFQYNICRRGVVESEAYENLFKATDLKLQAAFPLEGGILGGHIMRRRFTTEEIAQGITYHPEDRNIARDSGDIRPEIVKKVPRLMESAASIGLTPAQMSIAYVATNPHLYNILFGATKIWQLDEAIEAVEYSLENREQIVEMSKEFYVGGEAPKLFDFSFSAAVGNQG